MNYSAIGDKFDILHLYIVLPADFIRQIMFGNEMPT